MPAPKTTTKKNHDHGDHGEWLRNFTRQNLKGETTLEDVTIQIEERGEREKRHLGVSKSVTR